MDSEFLKKLASRLTNDCSSYLSSLKLEKEWNAHFVCTLEMNPQKSGNCTYKSLKAVIRALIAIWEESDSLQKKVTPEFFKKLKQSDAWKNSYKSFVKADTELVLRDFLEDCKANNQGKLPSQMMELVYKKYEAELHSKGLSTISNGKISQKLWLEIFGFRGTSLEMSSLNPEQFAEVNHWVSKIIEESKKNHSSLSLDLIQFVKELLLVIETGSEDEVNKSVEVFARLINIIDITNKSLMKEWLLDAEIALPFRNLFEKILTSKGLLNSMFDILCKYDVYLVKAQKKSLDEVVPKLLQMKNRYYQKKAFLSILDTVLEEKSWDKANALLDTMKFDDLCYAQGLRNLSESLIAHEKLHEARIVIKKLKMCNRPEISCPAILHYIKTLARKNMFEEALQAVALFDNNTQYKEMALEKIYACLERVKDQEKENRIEEIIQSFPNVGQKRKRDFYF